MRKTNGTIYARYTYVAYAFDENELEGADKRAIDAEYALPEHRLYLLVTPLLHLQRHVVHQPVVCARFLLVKHSTSD